MRYYYVKYALVVYTTTHKDRVKEVLSAVPEVVEEQGDFFFMTGCYKYGQEQTPEIAAAVEALVKEFGDTDAVLALAYLAHGEEGEIVAEITFETERYENLESWDEPSGWAYYDGYEVVVAVPDIEFVYVDLDTGTVINGPIARVPVNRITDDMGDSEVIAAAAPYRLWNI